MKSIQLPARATRLRLSAMVACALGAWSLSPVVSAMEIDAGNPDLKMRLDTQVRYALGVRGEKINPAFGNSPTYDETEYAFKHGRVMMNRLDLVSEFDAVYKDNFGIRLSGAAWYDGAYRKSVRTNPGIYNTVYFGAGAPPAGIPVSIPYSAIGNYVNNEYSSTTDRFTRGPSGNLLDAFVFANFQLGEKSAGVKLGKHTVYWGESIYTTFHGIAYSQAPLDGQKGASSPGLEAKEVFMPINQLSASLQLSDEWSLRGQYFLGWRPNRLPQGGTYFGSADMLFSGPDRLLAAVVPGAFFGSATDVPVFIPHGPAAEPKRTGTNNFGLNLRYSPASAPSTSFGAYYRKFDETQPWALVFKLNPVSPTPVNYHQAYAKDTQMLALSMATVVGPVSVGSELIYRKNTALNSASAFVSPNAATGGQPLDFNGVEGARGNTYHAVLNGVYLLPNTGLWESGTLIGELVYSRLDKVSKNPDLFNGVGYLGCTNATQVRMSGSKSDGCATKDVLLMQVGFTPQWLQVMPGVDLSAPISFSYGLHGNGATLGGGNEGSATWSLGLEADYHQKYKFAIAWADSRARYNTSNGIVTTVSGNAAQNDHGRLIASFKTSF
ncbi:MAG: DUF1302 family protein [Pseudomonadota bacterium]